MANVEALPNAFAQYTDHGWKLVPIPHGEKRPRQSNWNRIENTIADGHALSGGQNVLAFSMSIAHYKEMEPLFQRLVDLSTRFFTAENRDAHAIIDEAESVLVQFR